MQKVYLLLRNNKQTGPYSLEEILQLNLKPFDLVWVNGRSAAWQYPFEIAALKPYVSEPPQVNNPYQPIPTEALEEKFFQQQKPISQQAEAPKRVFVSVPKTHQPVEEKAAFPKQEASTALPYSQANASSISNTKQKTVEENLPHTNYARTLNEVEEEYTKWMYNKKIKRKSPVQPRDVVLAVLIFTIIGGGYYIMSKPGKAILPSAKTVEPKLEQATPLIVDKPSGSNAQATGYVEQNISVPVNPLKKDQRVSVNKLKSYTLSFKKPVSLPQNKNAIPVEKTISDIPIKDNNTVSKGTDVKQQPKAENKPVEKKKKIADIIKGFFTKKNKKEENKPDNTVLEDPKPAENRQSTKREANGSASNNATPQESVTVNVMDQVQLTSNAPENWMMGVKNLKITLHNRSNVTIQAASVTVSYYDQNNQLLDRKLLYFSNVAPKAKVTIAAPDSKWADHADFKLTSATAKEDKYASY